MTFDRIFALFIGPLLMFAALTARDFLRGGPGRPIVWFSRWRFNLLVALVSQILVELLVLLRSWVLR